MNDVNWFTVWNVRDDCLLIQQRHVQMGLTRSLISKHLHQCASFLGPRVLKDCVSLIRSPIQNTFIYLNVDKLKFLIVDNVRWTVLFLSCLKLHVWLWCLPGMWWPSVPWWTPKKTHRPSLSGTFWPDRRREVSTARALHIGPFSSQYSMLVTSVLFSHLLLLLWFNIMEHICSQMEPWWEVLCQDDHRHPEHLWDSSK